MSEYISRTETPSAESLLAATLTDMGAWTRPATCSLVTDPADPAFPLAVARHDRPECRVRLAGPAVHGYRRLSMQERRALASYFGQALASMGWEEDHVVTLHHPEVGAFVVYGVYVDKAEIMIFDMLHRPLDE